MSSSLLYPNNFSPSGLTVSIKPSRSQVITVFIKFFFKCKAYSHKAETKQEKILPLKSTLFDTCISPC